ncbi:unnamed protein product [Fusarium venenatum]|uniref:Uncharacterized protein n=1 Tax=Fusarium venenatum TaxID=56646 RepID=A0A2L2T801_9HYPO|nr:uncharacterized protein FVRRES_12859 [Fusarium venenatum]CEI40168.1 unnamed protein product [Fusarium venenatum]
MVPCPHSSPGPSSFLARRVLFFLRHKRNFLNHRPPIAVVFSNPLESARSRHSAKEKKSTNLTNQFPDAGIWYCTTTPHAETLFSPAQSSQAYISSPRE